MLSIKPISDLRNKFSEIEQEVITNNQPVFLTKNGYGSMVLMSLEQYDALINQVEYKLDEAELEAATSDERLTHEEVFSNIRRKIRG